MAAFVGIKGFSRLLLGAANQCFKRIGSSYQVQPNTTGYKLWESAIASVRCQSSFKTNRVPVHQEEVRDTSKEDEQFTRDVVEKVNSQITTNTTGRLFAVIQVCGKQFKVTNNDVIVIEGCWPPNVGDQLNLEKVLVVGSSDFTLFGTPLLNRELVSVDATVVEKTLSHTKTVFKKKRRKQYMRINFYRVEHTMLRINTINLKRKVGEVKDVEGLDRIF